MADIRREFEAKVIEKAQSDEAFRKQLLADPNAAIKSLGYTLAATTQWNVVEESGSKLFLVLPRKDAAVARGGKIGDEALTAVAGGHAEPGPRFSHKCPGCGVG